MFLSSFTHHAPSQGLSSTLWTGRLGKCTFLGFLALLCTVVLTNLDSSDSRNPTFPASAMSEKSTLGVPGN